MARTKSFSTAKKQEEAVIVGVVTQHQRLEQAEEYLDELAFQEPLLARENFKKLLIMLPVTK